MYICLFSNGVFFEETCDSEAGTVFHFWSEKSEEAQEWVKLLVSEPARNDSQAKRSDSGRCAPKRKLDGESVKNAQQEYTI